MPILKANRVKLSAAQREAHLKTLAGWMAAHAECVRGGPSVEAQVHVYTYWRCMGCSEGFIDPPRPF